MRRAAASREAGSLALRPSPEVGLSRKGVHDENANLGRPGLTCPAFPVPFVSPNGPPSPVALLSPNPSWGCFPDTNGVAIGHSSWGETYLFTANGGTDDVSVIDLKRALSGERTAEILRIPTQIGPWGIAASPNQRYIVAANRESQRVAFEGNTISIIDADQIEAARAINDPTRAEVARVRVGADKPEPG
ncbi:MAG TPA: hypothetical protein VKB92_14070 [Myxococcales bacterium]|nr:hypothetical protein [Myxococcales bacterium]